MLTVAQRQDLAGALLGDASSMDIDFGKPIAPGYETYATSGWGQARSGGVEHPGIDFRAPVGTPVTAVQAGTVINTGYDEKGGGNWIGIEHAKGWVSRYFHLSHIGVKKGQMVLKGQVIGKSGASGIRASAAHLHFDLKIPPELVPAIEREVGRPRTGPLPLRDGRAAVPAEPWIPVDRYQKDVVTDARANRIPLYHERRRLPAPTIDGVRPVTVMVAGIAASAVFLSGAMLYRSLVGGRPGKKRPRRTSS